MFHEFHTALRILVVLTVITGGLYPTAVTALAQLLFPARANGSLIWQGDELVGSELIGQPFKGAGYFWGRLSATPNSEYNAAASSGSNYGPLHPDLRLAALARIEALRRDTELQDALPVDLVTASGSGLDPHISPAAAAIQVHRIASARKVDERVVQELVSEYTESRQWGVFGEPRVNVLRLNIALDQL